MRPPRHTRTLTLGDRGRIPFAMIAVLLLVSSVLTVATLETRSSPEIDRDAELVMDRTVTAAQGEFRTAVLAASQRAGSAPITAYDESEIDAISAAEDQPAAFEAYLSLLIYLEAADHLPNADQRVGTDTESTVTVPDVTEDGAGDSIDPETAIDRVDLEIGHFEPGLEQGTIVAEIHGVAFSAETEAQELSPEERSIEVAVGSPVFELNDRMNEYESQLNADFFDEDVDSELNGLGQHLGARLYPFAYFKSGWDRTHRTTGPNSHDFEEVIDVNHTEVLANDAIFAVQDDVFGTRDPYADRTMRPGYICLSYQMGETLVHGGDDGSGSDDLVDESEIGIGDDATETEDDLDIDVEEQLCGGAVQEWIFGDQATGDLPEVPELSELIQDGLGEMDVMNEDEVIPVDDLAEATYMEYSVEDAQDIVGWMEAETEEILDEADDTFDDAPVPDGDGEYERSVMDIADELYEVDLERRDDVRVNGGLPSANPPADFDFDNYTEVSDTTRITDVRVTDVTHRTFESGADYDRTLHDVEATANVDLDRTTEWESDDPANVTPSREAFDGTRTVTLSADVSIDGEYEFNRQGEYYDRGEFPVATNPIETDYESADGNANFEGAFEEAIEAMTAADDVGSVESTLESELESISGTISSTGTIETRAEDALLEGGDSRTVGFNELKNADEQLALRDELRMDLEATHIAFLETMEAEPFTVDRIELTERPTPPERAKQHIQDEHEDDFVYDGFEDGYETPADKAAVQVRKAYFDRLYYWLDALAEPYEAQLEAIEAELDDVGEQGGLDTLDDSLGFAQDALNADLEHDPYELEGAAVLDDAQYEVSGSPTYLTQDNISEAEDPAVRPAGDTITDVDGETEHVAVGVHTENRLPWPGVPLTPYPPAAWVAQLNSWDVEVGGEYARFEVSSTIGDPSQGDRLTYVREHRPVELELHDGTALEVGSNEPITFESTTEVVVMMPGQVMGAGSIPAVADGRPSSSGTTFCSPTWDYVGPDFEPGDESRDHCLD